MTLESSATMMDAIFSSQEEENKGRLLKLMQEFLVSESTKHSAQEKGNSVLFASPLLAKRAYIRIAEGEVCRNQSGHQHG